MRFGICRELGAISAARILSFRAKIENRQAMA